MSKKKLVGVIHISKKDEYEALIERLKELGLDKWVSHFEKNYNDYTLRDFFNMNILFGTK